MASWCLLTRQAPDLYMRLSVLEREAFVDQAKSLREKGWI